MANKYDPSKPGILGKIRLAPTGLDANIELVAGMLFKSASDDTIRKWKREATRPPPPKAFRGPSQP